MKKMPRTVIILLLICFSCIFTCTNGERTSGSNTEINNSNIPTKLWSPNDPNLNSSWDWTNPYDEYGNPEIYELYVENSFVGQVIYEKQLPYFTYDGGPAANDLNQSLDIMPEYGWELFGRDFGSIEGFNRYVKMPWFALYNRARGILRFFYFNTIPSDYTYGIATLSSCDGNDGKIGIFNAFKQINASLDDYYDGENWNGIESIHAIESGKWCYADFDLSYDPAVLTDTNLVFNVWGTNEELVSYEGNVNLEQYIITENVGTNIFHNLISSIKAATGYYKSTKDALKAINEEEETKSNTNDKFALSTIASIAAIAGFVYNFASGMYEDQVVSMGYSGYFNITGTIIGYNDLDSYKMFAPGSEREELDSSYEPLYNNPMGIVSFKTRPKLGYKINTIKDMVICMEDYPNILQNGHVIECGLIEPIQLEINYERLEEEITHFNSYKNTYETYSFKIKSIEAAAVYADGIKPTIFCNENKVNIFEAIDSFYTNHNFFLDPITFSVNAENLDQDHFSDKLFISGGDEDFDCPDSMPNSDEDFDEMASKIYIAIRVLIEPVHTPSRYNIDGTYSNEDFEPIEIIRVIRPEYIKNPEANNSTLFTTPCDIPAELNGGVQIDCCE